MDALIIELVEMLLPGVVVGVFMAAWNRKQTKRETDAAARERARHEREKVELDLLMAVAKLSYASAIALKRGHANGEVEEGVEQYETAIRDFKDFERKYLAKF